MNEISFLQILYRNRLRLLVVSLVVAVVVGGISLFFPNKYSATAAITIQRPEVPISGEILPLQVEALRSLTESTRVKRKLYDRLLQEGNLTEEDTDFRRFQEMLSTRVQHVEGRERSLLPMVELIATSSDPALSAQIANGWAEVVLGQTVAIYRTGVDELSTFTNNIYEQVNQTLLEREDRYTQTRLETNLSVKQSRLGHNEETYSTLSQEVLQLQDSIATKKALLKDLERTLAEQEIEGAWIGEVFARNLVDDSGYTLTVATPLAERIVLTIRRLIGNEEAQAEFDQESQLDQKSQILQIKKEQVAAVSNSILEARTALSSLEPRYNQLREELQGMKPTITLNKALTDEAIIMDRFEEIAEGGKWPTMKTEDPNPVYQETQKETVQLAAEVNGLKNQVREGKEAIGELRKEIGEIAREIAPFWIKRRELRSAIAQDKKLLDYYRESYYADRARYESLEKEVGSLEAELAAKKVELDVVREEIASLEDEVFTGETKLARQARDVENLAQLRSSLSAKAEEVASLRVSMENISRSGTVLLYGAEADPDKTSPHRSRVVLVAVLLCLIVYSLVLILRELVAETEPGSPAEAP